VTISLFVTSLSSMDKSERARRWTRKWSSFDGWNFYSWRVDFGEICTWYGQYAV